MICSVITPLSSWSLAGEFAECNNDAMLLGVSGESLYGLIVGLMDNFPPLVDLIYMVSRMRVRWWGVTSVDAYTLIGVSFVSWNSPADPAQNELPHTAIESVGMVTSGSVERCFLSVSA